MKCSACNGKGYVPMFMDHDCPVCNGEGYFDAVDKVTITDPTIPIKKRKAWENTLKSHFNKHWPTDETT